jgi:hypothetical protein
VIIKYGIVDSSQIASIRHIRRIRRRVLYRRGSSPGIRTVRGLCLLL